MGFSELSWSTTRRFHLFRVVAVFSFLLVAPFVANTAYGEPQDASAETKSDAQKTPTQLGTISGHVYRADNNEPIPHAIVSLNLQGGRGVTAAASPQSMRTDVDGAFTFTAVAPGTYMLSAQHAGYINGFFIRAMNSLPEPIAVAAGDTLAKIDVSLLRAAVISGTILDEDNQPMEGSEVAAIRIRYENGGRLDEMTTRMAVSDDLGNFRLFDLPEGNYFVRVVSRIGSTQTEAPNFRFSYYPGVPTIEGAQKLKATAGEETSGVRFAIGTQNTYTISGSVIDHTDSPGPRRYNVNAIQMSEGGNFAAVNQNSTDSNYTIREVPSGEYSVTAQSLAAGPPGTNGIPTVQYAGSAMVRVGGNDARVNVQIGPAATVDGKIIIENSTGQSLSSIRVSLQSQTFNGGFIGAIANPSAGQNDVFKFHNMQSGSYYFTIVGSTDLYLKRAVCQGRDYTYRPLTIDPGVSIGNCAITLAADTAVMKGKVSDGDKPVPNYVVVAIPQSMTLRGAAHCTVTANTDASGAFQISGIVPGDYLVFAVPKDDEQGYFQLDFAERNQRDAERVSVKSGDTKTVMLKPSTSQ